MRPAFQALSRRAAASFRSGPVGSSVRAGPSSRCARTLWTQQNSAPVLPRRRATWMPLAFAAAGGAVISGVVLSRESVRLDAESDTSAARARRTSFENTSTTTPSSTKSSSASPSVNSPLEPTEAQTARVVVHAVEEVDADASSPTIGLTEPGSEEAESEAEGGGGAYDPVTGEINWDCPCLGGMAHGPCGQEFRAAFSCFVYSEDEPKGINCVELFKAMQDCFREHPEVYGEEIMNDDDDEGAPNTTSPEREGETVPIAPTSDAAVS